MGGGSLVLTFQELHIETAFQHSPKLGTRFRCKKTTTTKKREKSKHSKSPEAKSFKLI